MNNIIEDFCMAWQMLDAELIIKHLDDSFVYDSQWVFESWIAMDTRITSAENLRLWKKKDIRINASIVEDPYLGGQMLVFAQNGQSFYYRIKVKNGKVIKGDLCMF